MAKKPTITTVTTGYQGTPTINNNFTNVQNSFDNTLSLDGSTPNAMLADLDMNSNDILNAGEVSVSSLKINSQPVAPTSIVYNGVIKETKVATSNQTVFNLTTISYAPNTNNLSIYVDGVYQKPANYTENSATQVTFSVGLHVGAIVDFVVLSIGTLTGTADATNITYTPAAQSLYGTTSITVKSALDQVTHDETGSSKVGFLQSGTSATKRTVQAKLRDTISVKDFGAVGDGVTDDTAAVQNAVVYAEAVGADVIFPSGSYSLKQVFVTVGNISLIGQNATIIQNHDNVNSIVVGSPGEYKVSAAFFLKRNCNNVEITGFRFTTNDASFPALAAGFGSYFPSIGGQFADNVYIHHNVFSGGQDRCMFFQAGNGIRFENNTVFNNGFTIHIGYLKNVYFYDNSSDTSVKYSPTAVSITNNVFDGYSSDISTVMAHLTGCTDFTVRDNKFQNISIGSIGSCRVLRLYANDFGPYSQTGVQLDAISGTCFGNMIEGTFTTGIEVDGSSVAASSTWTTSFQMRILVEGNTVRGTGRGISVAEVQHTKVVNNYVAVSESALFLSERISQASFVNNYLETTGVGYNQSTVYAGWTAGTGWITFNGNKVVTPTGDQYVMQSGAVCTWFVCNDNYFLFKANTAASRPIVLTLAGKSWFANNIFNIETNVTAVTCLVLTGSGTAASVHVENNQLIATTGTGASTIRFCSLTTFIDAHVHRNICGGNVLIEDTNRVFVTDNTIIMPSSYTTSAVEFDNTGYASAALAQIHNNYILQGAAVNVPGILVTSNNSASLNTLSKVTMNRVEGNSTGALIEQRVHGTIQTIGNTIVNNGSGGTAVGVTGSATTTAL